MTAKSNRALGAALSVPAFLRDQAPLQKSESINEYLSLVMSLAGAVNPQQYLEWVFLKDVADEMWQIRRYLRAKTTALEIAQREQVEKFLKEAVSESLDDISKTIEAITGAKTKAFAWASDTAARDRINDHLAKHGYTADEVLTQAIITFRATIEGIDRLIEASMARRNSALRNIELFGRAYARRLEQASLEIVDAEFNEVPKPANTP